MNFHKKFILVNSVLISILFIGLGIFVENLFVSIIPAALLLFFFVLFDKKKIATALIISTAISIPLSYFISLDFDLFIVSEFFLVTLLFLFLIQLARREFPQDLLTNKISVLILIFLFWSIFTSFFSQMPLVSIKASLVRVWFVFGYFFFPIILFRNKEYSMVRWFTIFLIFISLVVVYALTRHYLYGIWYKKIAYWAAHPFFPDHTSYGALLSMFIPMLGLLSFSTTFPIKNRIGFGILFLLFLLGLLFSYSRAAWISVLGAFIIYLFLKFPLRLKIFSIFSVVTILLFIFLNHNAIQFFEKNQSTSSTELESHIKSATNIRNDISNLERINRWKAAIRMFETEPIVGFGPGTYMFCYAPYQMSYDRTPISTNSGDLGNAHSEYLGNLSEMGLPGMLLFITIGIVVFSRAIKLSSKVKSKYDHLWIESALIGLTTYFIHAFVNNFLDLDKLSFGFWGLIAVIAFYDLKFTLQTPELKE